MLMVGVQVEEMLGLRDQEPNLLEQIVIPLGDHDTEVAAGAKSREHLLIIIRDGRPRIEARARAGAGVPVATLLGHHRQAVDVDYAFANFSVHSLAVAMAAFWSSFHC